MTPTELTEEAFAKLQAIPGFTLRENQRQLALLISDCIESGRRGSFEAPTGLGKSLACLIPAIANAMISKKRTIIATYTNVLAEQYWRNDLPRVLELFGHPEREEDGLKVTFLIGRQRYACRAEMATDRKFESFLDSAELGTEGEYRSWAQTQGSTRDLLRQWSAVMTPPVCPGRQCPFYNDCYYYSARRDAEKAHVVITNHSVVLQDALLRDASEGEQGMLGNYDFVILDEAHDFTSAAQNSLEIEITESKLEQVLQMALKLYDAVLPGVKKQGNVEAFTSAFVGFGDGFRRTGASLKQLVPNAFEAALLRVAPGDLRDHHALKSRSREDLAVTAESTASNLAAYVNGFLAEVRKHKDPSDNSELIRTYMLYLGEFGEGCLALFPKGDDTAEVTYADGGDFRPSRLRRDLVDLGSELRRLVWEPKPWICLSATLVLDGTFDYFERTSGSQPEFTEVLPSPFDYGHQAALYLPRPAKLMDATEARKTGREVMYWQMLADEIGEVIRACRGRTLVLFASRREMEEVHKRLPTDLPGNVFVQRPQGAAATGARFRNEIESSLFALRSFWTGFDAPGETCFCVALVRVPFEPPTDPVALTRMVWLQKQGLDPFQNHTLPQAKMMMRQGTGRLIRRSDDRGIIAMLDVRLQTKRYGEEILDNLPNDMRRFNDIWEAVAHVESR
jgi:ATP-dependent DNA helicase DinG